MSDTREITESSDNQKTRNVERAASRSIYNEVNQDREQEGQQGSDNSRKVSQSPGDGDGINVGSHSEIYGKDDFYPDLPGNGNKQYPDGDARRLLPGGSGMQFPDGDAGRLLPGGDLLKSLPGAEINKLVPRGDGPSPEPEGGGSNLAPRGEGNGSSVEKGAENSGSEPKEQAVQAVQDALAKQGSGGAQDGLTKKPNNGDPFDGKGLDDITPSGVNQTTIGDCYFEASLASMAGTKDGKQQIHDMIKQNQDGSYTVTFPGDKEHPMQVTRDDLDKATKSGQVQDNATWAKVLQTAFLKYEHGGVFADHKIPDKNEGIPDEAGVRYQDQAMHLLTGKDVALDSMSNPNLEDHELLLGSVSKENVARTMEDALKNGEPIVCSTNGDSPLTALSSTDARGVPENHVYSVTGYDPKTGQVTVRNPWGHNRYTPFETRDDQGNLLSYNTVDGVKGGPDGTLTMSLDTFMNRFGDIHVGGENPYVNDARNVARTIADRDGELLDAAGDAVHGDIKGAAGHVKDAVIDHLKAGQEVDFAITDGGERMAGAAIDRAEDTASKVADGAKKAAHKVADFVDDWNPFS